MDFVILVRGFVEQMLTCLNFSFLFLWTCMEMR